MFADKALHCDCGYEVRALDENAFIEAIRRHASEAHGIDFSIALARDIAKAHSSSALTEEGGRRSSNDR